MVKLIMILAIYYNHNMGCKMCLLNERHELNSIKPEYVKHNDQYDKNNISNNKYFGSSNVANPSKHNNCISDIHLPMTSDRSNQNPSDTLLKSAIPTNSTKPGSDLVSNESLKMPSLNMTLSTSLFRKENKQSIFNNYDMLEVLGKGNYIMQDHLEK